MKFRYQILISLITILTVLTIGTFEIFAAACISGLVKDKAGNPVANGDIDIIVASTGVKLITPGDNTDINGYYSICVLPGIYHVTYAPPDSSHLLGHKILNVDLTDNQPQAINITLDSGLSISGRITDPLGQPVVDADIDVDSIAGGRVYTPNDNSAIPSGSYWIVVPPGLFRVRYDSPVGSRLRGQELDSVNISSDTVIDIVLPEGWLLSGQVTNSSGLPLAQVEIGLRDALTGEKIFISNKDTDTTGLYQVVVPTGLFELRFAGPPGSSLIGAKTDSVDVFSDMIWDQVLLEGIVLTVQVENELGVPIKGADIDLKLTATGEKLFTPNDRTDKSGVAAVAVRPDIYLLQIDPPPGSSYDQMIIPNLILTNDTTVTVTLPTVTRLNISGRVVGPEGFGVLGVQLNLFSALTGRKVYLVNNLTDSSGDFSLAVPEGEFDLTVAPPKGSRLVGQKILGLSFTVDSQLDEISLAEGLLISVSVIDDLSLPVAGVDLDLVNRATGEELFTPRDNTDENGRAVVTVDSGVYTIMLEPIPESGLSLLIVDGVSLFEDTLLTFLLGSALPGAVPANFELGQNYPNPFNAATIIPVTLVTGSYLTVEIFNNLGQKVRTIENRHREAGVYNLSWDSTDFSGAKVASGIYFYRVKTPFGTDTRQMILIR